MTSDKRDNTSYSEVIEILGRDGIEGMAELFKILMNEAMKAERATVLQAAPYERTEQRQGYALTDLNQRPLPLGWERSK